MQCNGMGYAWVTEDGKKSFNKTVIDFNFGRHEDLLTLKSDIGKAASMNYHFLGVAKSSRLPH